MVCANASEPSAGRRVSFREAWWTWCRVAALSFGGPAGQIAVMHRIVVEEKKWLGEERFLHALNYCMLLPGPEAQQLATYIGWLLHRTPGGLVAGVLFIVPGFVSILALSMAYAVLQQTDVVQAMFFGLKPAVLAIVVQAVVRLGKRVLNSAAMFTLAAASFVAIFLLDVPFPWIVLGAGFVGLALGRLAPQCFLASAPAGTRSAGTAPGGDAVRLHRVQPTLRRSLLVAAICLALWFAPLAMLYAALGGTSVYVQEGVLFSKAAVVTFGGAYSALAYIAQQAVERYGWLEPGEMLDGLGMAETTPGPLIQVVQFVGFMGAYRDPGPLTPLGAGIAASVLTTWVTFVPCFLGIFLGAPYIESLRGNVLLGSALSAITAAVVGVVLNLAVWFSLHTLFDTLSTQYWLGLRLLVPEPASIRGAACVVAVAALLLTFYYQRGMMVTLGACAALGSILYLAGR
jgi:chromate transporter